MALLRPRPAARMDAHATPRTHSACPTRAPTLPNPLPAHLLDDAHPLALSFSCALSHYRTPGVGRDHRLLAKSAPVIFALLRAAVRYRPVGSASHRLRPRDPGSGIPVALRLDRNPTGTRHVQFQTPPLSRVGPSADRPTRALDTLPALRPRDGRSLVCNMGQSEREPG